MKKFVLLFFAFLLFSLWGCDEPEPPVPQVPAHEHLYDSGAVTTPPTHLENGLMTYRCVSCGESYTDTIEKSGTHTWEFVSVDGDKHRQGCACGYSISTDSHIFRYGEVIKEPSPDMPGEREISCVLCSYKTTKEVLYITPETDEDNKGEEIMPDNLILLRDEGAGEVKYQKIEDCALLSEGYSLSRVGDGMLGVEMPIRRGLFEKERVYVLSFKGKAENFRRIKVEILAQDGTVLNAYNYNMAVQYTEFSLPFTASTNEYSVRLSADDTPGECVIGGIHIVPSTSSNHQRAESGYAMIPDSSWQAIDVDYYENRVEGTTAARDVLVTKDGYVYLIGTGGLRVYRENGTEPILLWGEDTTLNPMGEIRQMDLTDDEKTIVIVSRTGGVHLYDITNREAPVRVCHMDSLEMATGVDTNGDYLYIAERGFGVSIHDISNPAEPKFVSSLNAGETQDCTYYNGFVYCGIWGASMVRIYDVRDIDNPKHAYDIQLSGRGDGVTLSGGMLYAATGHHEYKQTGTENIGYGTGNGMEIWDITDPYAPVCQSIVRCDGRTYVNSPDIWRITLADQYAFLSCSYTGIYVYDVSNPKAPLRIAHINVRADAGTPEYKNVKTKSTHLVPYDSTKKMNAAIIDCDVADGILYIAAHSAGLYTTPIDFYSGARREEDTTIHPTDNEFKFFEQDNFEEQGVLNPEIFRPGSQIWSVHEKDGYLYVAAGIGGIYVLDGELNVLSNVKTKDACYDIAIYGNVIYTAESVSGVGVYYIDENDPTKIVQHSVHHVGTMTQATIAPGGKFLLCHSGNIARLIDVRDHENLTVYKEYSNTMYYQHQISFKAAANRYLWCYSTISNVGVIIDFGPDGSYDEPVSTNWADCAIGFNAGGITAVGDYFFVNSGRYYLVDPSDQSIFDATFKQTGSYVHKSQASVGAGVPTVIGNYLFVRNRINGTLNIWKWASNDYTKMPVKIMSISTVGHFANPVMIGNRVYIPMAYGGLLAFDLPQE